MDNNDTLVISITDSVASAKQARDLIDGKINLETLGKKELSGLWFAFSVQARMIDDGHRMGDSTSFHNALAMVEREQTIQAEVALLDFLII